MDIVKYWSDRLPRLRDEAPVGHATRVRLRHHGSVDQPTSDRHDHNAPHHRRCEPIVGWSDEYTKPTGTRLVTGWSSSKGWLKSSLVTLGSGLVHCPVRQRGWNGIDRICRTVHIFCSDFRRFYRVLIRKADERFDRQLERLAKEGRS